MRFARIEGAQLCIETYIFLRCMVEVHLKRDRNFAGPRIFLTFLRACPLWLMIWPIPRWRILTRQPSPCQEETNRGQRVDDREKKIIKKKHKNSSVAFFYSHFPPQRFSLAQLRHPPSRELSTYCLSDATTASCRGPRTAARLTIRSNIARPLAGRAGRQRPLAQVANVPLTTPWPKTSLL